MSYTIAIPLPETTHINAAFPDFSYFSSPSRMHGANNKLKPASVCRELAQVQLLNGRSWLADMTIVSGKLRRVGVSYYGSSYMQCCRCLETWSASAATWNSPRGSNSTWVGLGGVWWSLAGRTTYLVPWLMPDTPWDLAITDLVTDAIANRDGHLNLVSMLVNETGVARAEAVTESGQAGTTMPVLLIEFEFPGQQGYEIYCEEGREAEPGVDTPIAWIAPSAYPSMILDEATLCTDPLATYYVSIVAVNEYGRAASWPTFTLQTPSPVHSVKAMASAGGKVDVAWQYDETTSLAVADDFVITQTPLSGQAIPGDVTVLHEPPRRDYRKSLTLPEGAWRLHVYSRRQGVFRSPVSGVAVRVDLTAPTYAIVGLTASGGG